MKKDKPYWRETIECYVLCFASFALFLGVIIVSGQITGTNWIGLIKQMYQTFI